MIKMFFFLISFVIFREEEDRENKKKLILIIKSTPSLIKNQFKLFKKKSSWCCSSFRFYVSKLTNFSLLSLSLTNMRNNKNSN
jgi:hypothetical protein